MFKTNFSITILACLVGIQLALAVPESKLGVRESPIEITTPVTKGLQVGVQQVETQPEVEPKSVAVTDRALVDDIGKWYRLLYLNMPLPTFKEDRCSVYSRVIEAAMNGQLKISVAAGLLAQTIDKAERGASAYKGGPPVYKPDDQVKTAFIAVLAELDPHKIGPGVYLDLVSCAKDWKDENSVVDAFLSTPELLATVRDLTSDV